MSKGSGNRTENRERYRERFDQAFPKYPVLCTCGDGMDPECPVHNCEYCGGTGKRWNGEVCNHRPLGQE